MSVTQPHGTRARYAGGCRCEECREANTEWQREYRADNPDIRHRGRVQADAYNAAMRRLREQHRDEFDTLLTEERHRRGLP